MIFPTITLLWGVLVKIGILAGTGNMGCGLALRLSLKHDIRLVLGTRRH